MKKTTKNNNATTFELINAMHNAHDNAHDIECIKRNDMKTNVRVSVDYNSLYNELINATCKRDLVDAMNKHGLRTTTLPTPTPNKNDLYIQFCEKSRILIGAKTLKFYTCDDIAKNEYFKSLQFDCVNDGSYRTKRSTVSKSLDNFKYILQYFMNEYENDMILPTN